MKDYYKILEVDFFATHEQIRAQHRFLLQAWHPDKFPTTEQKKKAEERVREINEAYGVLSDPNRRDRYDHELIFAPLDLSQSTTDQVKKTRSAEEAGHRCDICNVKAKTHHVSFYETLGNLFTRQRNSVKGNLCKACIDYYFWNFTGKTMLLGWWGVTSFFITPFILLNNIFQYGFTIGMEKPERQITPNPLSFWVFSLIGCIILCAQAFLAISITSALDLKSTPPAPKVSIVSTETALPTSTQAQASQSVTNLPLSVACVPQWTTRETALVAAVIDGDTIDVKIDNQDFRVQYIGVNAPEQNEPFFDQASALNQNLVSNNTVTLVKDVSDTDAYGRLLRYVFVGDTFVNYELIREGYAQAARYTPDISCASFFANAQSLAQTDSLGLWMSAPTSLPVPTSVTPLPTLSPVPLLTTPTTASGNCDPAYPDVCIPSPPPDLDCSDIPYRDFKVLAPDPHNFDRDGDGIGCEN